MSLSEELELLAQAVAVLQLVEALEELTADEVPPQALPHRFQPLLLCVQVTYRLCDGPDVLDFACTTRSSCPKRKESGTVPSQRRA